MVTFFSKNNMLPIFRIRPTFEGETLEHKQERETFNREMDEILDDMAKDEVFMEALEIRRKFITEIQSSWMKREGLLMTGHEIDKWIATLIITD